MVQSATEKQSKPQAQPVQAKSSSPAPAGVQMKKAVAGMEGYDAQAAALAPVQMSAAPVQRKSVSGGPELAEVQKKLNKLGFDCGTPDGIMGSNTRKAIVAFQTSKGLDPDGAVGPKTLAALEAAAAGAPATAANASQGAASQAPASQGAASQAPASQGAASQGAASQGNAGQSAGQANAKSETPAAPAQTEGAAPASGDWRDALLAKRDAIVHSAKLTPGKGGTPPTEFTDGALEKARKHYMGQLGVADAAPAPSQDDPAAAAGGKADAVKKTAGDSEAKDVASAPKWFNVFQDHLIESSDWTTDHKLIQMLVSAWLFASNESAPANVKAFYDQIGKSEKNGQAGDLSYGAGADIGNTNQWGQNKSTTKEQAMKNAGNWCQQASTDAYARGFHNAGYKFKPRKASELHQNQLGLPKGQTVVAQGALAAMMAFDMPKLMPPKPGETAVKGKAWGAVDAWALGLEPGDLCSFVSSKSAKGASGHAVTIVSADQGGDRRAIKYVSGNAGSQTANNGSVRFEEATWIPAPANFSSKETRPQNSGEVYVYSITKTSKMQPEHIDEMRKSLGASFESTFNMSYDASADQRAKSGA